MIMKKKLREGKSLMGTMINLIDNPNIVRVLKQAGFDYIIIDCEHGPYTYQSVAAISSMAKGYDLGVIVRVCAPEREIIQRFADIGIDGIMVPGVESREQIEKAISYARYKPYGKRGITVGPVVDYKMNFNIKEEIERVNDNFIIIAQIESKEAVDDIENILSAKGIDVVLFGPIDLSNSFDLVGQTNHPIILEAIDKVLKCADEKGIITGNHTGSMDDLEWGMERGMRLITWSFDVSLIQMAAKMGIDRLTANDKFIK